MDLEFETLGKKLFGKSYSSAPTRQARIREKREKEIAERERKLKERENELNAQEGALEETYEKVESDDEVVIEPESLKDRVCCH